MASGTKARSYAEYLRVPELLALQTRVSDAHDELQFIIVHQSFELWFKLLLYELEALREALDADDAAQSLHLLRRGQEIVRLLTAGFGVIETMRSHDFLEFRSLLQPASGFQSVQFRELEFLCGAKDPRYLALAEGEARDRLQRRLVEPTLWDAYVGGLGRAGLPVTGEAAILGAVIEVLKSVGSHPLGAVTEGMIELDELFLLWRQRHLAMTMRMIGARPGTGHASVATLVEQGYQSMGSGGVDYLRSTLSKVFFPLLWEARTFMQR